MPQQGAASSARGPDFYDAVYLRSPWYRSSWDMSGYAPIWIALCEELRRADVTSVLDLGCGPGQFAACLHKRCPAVSYVGVDFSPVAIDFARRMNPGTEFRLGDINDEKAFDGDYDAVVATEVLEHIDDDTGLLRRIPASKLVAFSVPNFDDRAHVRYFDTAKSVYDWYEPCLAELDIRWIHTPSSRGFWLGVGRTKP